MPTPRILLFAALVLAACQREQVTHYRIAKTAPAAAAAQAPQSPPQQRAPGTPQRQAASGLEPARPDSGLAWTLPKGWTQSAGGGMRYATIKPANGEGIEISVVVLPGEAGGEVANVNRWRGQLGAAPLDEKSASAARTLVQTKAGPFALYDFQGPGAKATRMIAALAVVDGNTWFLKMLGDPRAVGAARTDFIHLLEGLHVEG
jgi:hypothetical protein